MTALDKHNTMIYLSLIDEYIQRGCLERTLSSLTTVALLRFRIKYRLCWTECCPLFTTRNMPGPQTTFFRCSCSSIPSPPSGSRRCLLRFKASSKQFNQWRLLVDFLSSLSTILNDHVLLMLLYCLSLPYTIACLEWGSLVRKVEALSNL